MLRSTPEYRNKGATIRTPDNPDRTFVWLQRQPHTSPAFSNGTRFVIRVFDGLAGCLTTFLCGACV